MNADDITATKPEASGRVKPALKPVRETPRGTVEGGAHKPYDNEDVDLPAEEEDSIEDENPDRHSSS